MPPSGHVRSSRGQVRTYHHTMSVVRCASRVCNLPFARERQEAARIRNLGTVFVDAGKANCAGPGAGKERALCGPVSNSVSVERCEQRSTCEGRQAQRTTIKPSASGCGTRLTREATATPTIFMVDAENGKHSTKVETNIEAFCSPAHCTVQHLTHPVLSFPCAPALHLLEPCVSICCVLRRQNDNVMNAIHDCRRNEKMPPGMRGMLP